jgi:hypothetical protein
MSASGGKADSNQTLRNPKALPASNLTEYGQLVPGAVSSWNNQFNYPVDTETVEAPSLPRHTLADPVVVNCHGHSERSRRLAARQLHLSGYKSVIVFENDFSLLLDGPGILPTRRRTVEQGSPLLG